MEGNDCLHEILAGEDRGFAPHRFNQARLHSIPALAWYFEVRDLERINRAAFKIWARQQANVCQIIISVWRDHVLNISHKKNIADALAVSSKVKVDASLRRHTLFTVFLLLCLMHIVVPVPLARIRAARNAKPRAGEPASPRPGAPPQLRGARLAP
jgi:hypothetical protein